MSASDRSVSEQLHLRTYSSAYLFEEIDRLRDSLEKIATPKRLDGTYNLSREACEQVAREALRLAPEQAQDAPRQARDGCRTCHRPWEECEC